MERNGFHHRYSIERLLQMLDVALKRENERQKSTTVKASNFKIGMDAEFAEHRRRVVSWLIDLNVKFEFHNETLFLSVAIFDHFLASVKAHSKYLNCIGITCLYLAAKTAEEDNMVPDTLTLVRKSECGCSMAEILRMERCILNKLDWDLRFSTSLDFLYLYHGLLMSQCPHALDGTRLSPSQHVARLTCSLQSCLLDPRLAGFTPSTLALTVISLDMEFLGWQLWLHATVTLQSYAQINGRELVWCRERVVECLYSGNKRLPPRTPLAAAQSHHRATSDPDLLVYPKPAKRKAHEIASDDFFDGIKRLYGEDSSSSLQQQQVSSSVTVPASTCAGEVLRHSAGAPGAGAPGHVDRRARVNN